MPISDQQLHHAAKYITERCKLREASFGSDKLSNTLQKHLELFLFSLFRSHNKERSIVIGLHKKPMKPLRQYLGENNLLFPNKTEIVINCYGTTTCNGEVIFNFNEEKNKAMQQARRLTSEATVSIRRNSSADLSDTSSSIARESSSDISRTIRRTTSDSSLSIKRISSLTFQFSELSTSIEKLTTSTANEQALTHPQDVKQTPSISRS